MVRDKQKCSASQKVSLHHCVYGGFINTGVLKSPQSDQKETSYSDKSFQCTYILFIIIFGGILILFIHNKTNIKRSWSQWPCGLRRRFSATRLLRSWVRIPPEAWKLCCECCVLSGRGLCDGLIIRSEESYRLWRVVVCDQETS